MKITYSVWQGSLIKGSRFTASSMAEVVKTIDELNSTGIKPKFEAFISQVEQDNKKNDKRRSSNKMLIVLW